jgi:REP element-mobilizing transposase RayT
MTTHIKHFRTRTFYFITFTCNKWLPLIEETGLYNYFPKVVLHLENKGVRLSGYVLMPNHIHLLVYVEATCKSLNRAIGESKRFMAYKIVKRLREAGKENLLKVLAEGVAEGERRKNKKHQVFRLSFDAKQIEGDVQINAILDYIHSNPVKGRWNLVDDYRHYPYSSARFYEEDVEGIVKVWDFRTVASESSVSDSEGG